MICHYHYINNIMVTDSYLSLGHNLTWDKMVVCNSIHLVLSDSRIPNTIKIYDDNKIILLLPMFN